MNILYFWISIVLIFLIIEFSTATFYGLALSLAAGVVALYVFFMQDMELSILQGYHICMYEPGICLYTSEDTLFRVTWGSSGVW